MLKMSAKFFFWNKKISKIICCIIFLNMSFAAFGMGIPAARALVLAKEAARVVATVAITEILKFKALFVQKIDLVGVKAISQPLSQKPLNQLEPIDIFKGHGLQEQVLKEVFAQMNPESESKQTNLQQNVTYFKNLTQRQNEKSLEVGTVLPQKDADSAIANTNCQSHEVEIVLAQPQQARFEILHVNHNGMVISNGSETYTLTGTATGTKEKSFPRLSIDLPVDKQKVGYAAVNHFNDLFKRSETGSLTLTVRSGMATDAHLVQSLRLIAKNQLHTQKAIILGRLISEHANEFLQLLKKNDALYKGMFDQKISELERIKKRLEFGILRFELPSFLNEYATSAQRSALRVLFDKNGNIFIWDGAQEELAKKAFAYYAREVSLLENAIHDAKAGKKDIQAAPILLAKSEDNWKAFKRGFLEPFAHQETLEEIRTKIRENKGNQYLYDAICSVQEGKLEQANALLKKAEEAYRANGAKSLNACAVVADFIRKEQIRLHDLYIDKHELPRAYANDPLYAEYHAILDKYGPDYAKMRSNAMLQLTLRQMAVQGLYEKLAITQRTTLLDKLFYGICELQYHPIQTLKYLASQDICKNSLIEEHRVAYNQIFTDAGIPKFYAVRSEYTSASAVSDAIHNSENLAARILQTEFFMHDAKNAQEIELIKLGIACIHKSVAENGILKSMYAELAQNLFDALITPEKSEQLQHQIDIAVRAFSLEDKNLHHAIAGIVDQQFNLLKTFKGKPHELGRIYSVSEAINAIITDIQENRLSAAILKFKEFLASLLSDDVFSPHLSKDLLAICGLEDLEGKEKFAPVPPCIAVPKEDELPPTCNVPEMENPQGMQGRLPGLEADLKRMQEEFEAYNSEEAQESVLPECGHSQSKNLPSFGQEEAVRKEKGESESRVDEQEKGAADAGELKKIEEGAAEASDRKELASEERLQDAIKKLLNVESCTQEELVLVDKFVASLIRLIKNYGSNEVINAIKLFKVTQARIISDKFILSNIEEVAKVLKRNANCQSAEFKETMELIDDFYNGAQYHTDIDREKLKMAIELFKNTPGAIIDDGPLKKVLKFGKADSSDGDIAIARGAMYELECALRLSKNNKKILAFAIRLRGNNSKNEFDILTKDTLIECKDINWETQTEIRNEKTRNTILRQLNIAQDVGLVFEVHSKKNINLEQKQWFDRHGINYIEESNE